MKAIIENILDIIKQNGEEETLLDLSCFRCSPNSDIQEFLLKNAIEFAKKRISVTYIVENSDNGELLGYFTLAHKVLEVNADLLSNTQKRKMEHSAKQSIESKTYKVSAFLLAQFGKNYAVDEDKRISGEDLLNCVEEIIEKIQYMIGGTVLYLDCEDKDVLTSFYEQKGRFHKIGERVSETDNKTYLQYVKFI